jgi:hypothetical protein
VVDVIGEAAAVVEIDQVPDDRHEIVLGQDGVVRVGLELEPLVDLVAAHPAQIVSLRVEEELLELLASRLQVGRIARPQQGVDLLQGLRLAVSRVLGQRVLDQRRLGTPGRKQNLHLMDARFDQFLPEDIGQLGPGLRHHFAGVGIGRIERQHVILPVAG